MYNKINKKERFDNKEDIDIEKDEIDFGLKIQNCIEIILKIH